MSTKLRLLMASVSCGWPCFVAAQAAPPQALDFTAVADGLYVFEGETLDLLDAPYGMVANISFVVGDSAVAVIDTGASLRQGRLVREAIRKHTALPIRYVINTHVHPDHIFGDAAFTSDQPEFIAHQRFAAELRARGAFYLSRTTGPWYEGTTTVEPTDAVSRRRTINLGNRELTLMANEPAHSSHDLSVYDSKSRTLIAGDLVFVEHCPSLEGSIGGWITALQQIEAAAYAHIVPGHGPVQTGNEAVGKQRQYLEQLAIEVRTAIAEGVDLQTASSTLMQDAVADWQLCDSFHTRNVIQAYTELEWE